ncbi:catalase [Haematococcus lacustris]|uniref:catalase n=1 Tax=Haematococcus lacustris TaxID=44745 RepID=A0A699ZRI6_HAELA|nr:catalase [Haematococcus lacustris]
MDPYKVRPSGSSALSTVRLSQDHRIQRNACCRVVVQYRPSSAYDSAHWTTNTGMPVFNNNSSLTVGSRGPILLEDYHLVEKLAQFDRERIPERVVHARGAVAKGFFEVTHDVSHLTCADFLRAPGVQTPVIVRFSTVVHERGSPETLRDPRGFAVKFYTREGNYDMVGNNMPVFFIRDGMKFPDMVHAFKPSPKTHMQEGWRIMDFLSHHPESAHMLSFLLDDVGIPKCYRTMPGFGVHTFRLMAANGKETLVKFHWIPKAGTHSLLDEEAVVVGGTNHSHATKDLYDAIAAGDYPEWTLAIQTMDPKDEDKFDFDPLDVTKTWPEDIFPLQPIGRMVLNRNPDNFFAENEQLAFCPSLIVPGIQYTEDKLLQTRIFSYADTQRHRLGPNYLLLPVNAPKCAYHNNHHEGAMNFLHRDEEINYFPSRFDPVRHAKKYPIPSAVISGRREKVVIAKENNFAQAGQRWRSFDAARQARFVDRAASMLSDAKCSAEIRRIWVGYWTQADQSLGGRVAQKLQAMGAL